MQIDGLNLHPAPPCRNDVLSALPDCGIFHFAGHADAKESDSMRSCLLLKDWEKSPLTVESVFETTLSENVLFLAYLSACGTGRNRSNEAMDESIQFTSAFQLAGFRHVIRTLWDVVDKLCVDMARSTYEYLQREGISDENVGGALHHATRELGDDWVRNSGGLDAGTTP